jgi:hypothetical protein
VVRGKRRTWQKSKAQVKRMRVSTAVRRMEMMTAVRIMPHMALSLSPPHLSSVQSQLNLPTRVDSTCDRYSVIVTTALYSYLAYEKRGKK